MAASDKDSGGDPKKNVSTDILSNDDRSFVDDLLEEEAFQEDIFADELSDDELDEDYEDEFDQDIDDEIENALDDDIDSAFEDDFEDDLDIDIGDEENTALDTAEAPETPEEASPSTDEAVSETETTEETEPEIAAEEDTATEEEVAAEVTEETAEENATAEAPEEVPEAQEEATEEAVSDEEPVAEEPVVEEETAEAPAEADEADAKVEEEEAVQADDEADLAADEEAPVIEEAPEEEVSVEEEVQAEAEEATASEESIETEAAEAAEEETAIEEEAAETDAEASETDTEEVPITFEDDDDIELGADDDDVVDSDLDDIMGDDESFDDDSLDGAFDEEFDEDFDEDAIFSEDDMDEIPLFEDMDDDDLENDIDRSVEKANTAAKEVPAEAPAEKPKKKKKPSEPGAAGKKLKEWLEKGRAAASQAKEKVGQQVARFKDLPKKKKIMFGSGAGALLLIASASMVFSFGEGDDAAAPQPENTTELVTTQTATNPPQPPPPQPLVAEDSGDNRMTHTQDSGSPAPLPVHGSAVDNYHAAGETYFREGRYPEAIEAFESDISSAYLFLARCYQILGENEEALKNYQRVLWEYPDRSAFVEVYSLAEEMYTAGEFWTARKLYYTFISHVDKMPGSVKKMVPRAYFRICQCFEQEALGLYHGNQIEPPQGNTWGRTRPLTMQPKGATGADFSGETDTAWKFTPPYRIDTDTHRVNDYLNRYTVECVGAPAYEVFSKIAEEAGLNLVVEDSVKQRLDAELVSAFMNERPIEEILEYVAGQAGMIYSLDEKRIRVVPLENYIQGGWVAMKDEAIKAFRRSLYRFLGHDDAPKVYFEISKLHYLAGDFDAAISPAKTLIVEYPEFSQVPLTLLNIASCYMELGDFTKARQNLSELVNKYTAHPVAQEGYLLLARCWWKEGNPAAAQLTLRTLEDRFPDSHLRHEGKAVLGRILLSLGQYGEVIKLTKPVMMTQVEKDDTAISLQLLKTEALLRSGEPQKSVHCAVELLERFPGNDREMDALYLLAESYFDLDEFFLAYSTCKAIRDNYTSTMTDPFLYLMAGKSLQKLGFYDKALEWLDTGLSRCTEGTLETYEMYLLLGDLLFEMGRFERAKVVYRKVREHYEFQNEADKKYVKSLMEQKDFDSALNVLNDLVVLAVGDPGYQAELYRMAGDCYTEMGETEAAIDAYKGILEEKAPNAATDMETSGTGENQ